MRVGYLHIGSPAHGVVRYGRVLADAARTHLDAEVQEAVVELDAVPSADERRLRRAVQQLAADVVHLQYNERVWGDARAAANVRVFAGACTAPLVATLHDVRRSYGWGGIVRRLWTKRAARHARRPSKSEEGGAGGGRSDGWLASLRRAARYAWKERQNARATRRLVRRAGRVLVCTKEEARRLQGTVPEERLTVIPHFVEARTIDASQEEAKGTLGLAGRRVCTVLGFIHRAKGHALVVEALPQWPADVQVVFAGRPARGSEEFTARLRARAEALGVADRLRVTGYLSEAELNRYLAATDLALCPFEEISASGSLATWIAAARPMLASNRPQIAEYNARAPGAIATFSPYTPAALAAATRALLSGEDEAGHRARTQLRDQLSLPRIVQQHADVYRRVVARNVESPTPHSSK